MPTLSTQCRLTCTVAHAHVMRTVSCIIFLCLGSVSSILNSSMPKPAFQYPYFVWHGMSKCSAKGSTRGKKIIMFLKIFSHINLIL